MSTTSNNDGVSSQVKLLLRDARVFATLDDMPFAMIYFDSDKKASAVQFAELFEKQHGYQIPENHRLEPTLTGIPGLLIPFKFFGDHEELPEIQYLRKLARGAHLEHVSARTEEEFTAKVYDAAERVTQARLGHN